MTGRLVVTAPDGVGEVTTGDDVGELVVAHCDLADGDVVAVTSKVVSKAEGRLREGPREASLAEETRYVVARRGATAIVRTRLGLTIAAAGIDASNVPSGRHLLLPVDPDGSARRIRRTVAGRTGRTVAVLLTDTAGRAWRTGQTDIAVGAAGLRVVDDHAGRTDAHGNPLEVTAPAVADELAGAAELATGKLGGRPFAVLRGRADLVLPADDDGPGAAALVRPDGADMFGLGAREAVVRALVGDAGHLFGDPAPAEELAAALSDVLGTATGRGPGGVVVATCPAPYEVHAARAAAVAHAFGWTCDTDRSGDGTVLVRCRPATP